MMILNMVQSGARLTQQGRYCLRAARTGSPSIVSWEATIYEKETLNKIFVGIKNIFYQRINKLKRKRANYTSNSNPTSKSTSVLTIHGMDFKRTKFTAYALLREMGGIGKPIIRPEYFPNLNHLNQYSLLIDEVSHLMREIMECAKRKSGSTSIDN